jgi:lysophospholipase L1-like esterase
MVRRLRAKNVRPVFLSSIERRRFDRYGKAYDTLREYPLAMEACAKSLGIPFYDMTHPTLALLDELGEERSRILFNQGIWPNYPDGVEDNTHLSLYGAQSIAGMIATLLSPLPFVRTGI